MVCRVVGPSSCPPVAKKYVTNVDAMYLSSVEYAIYGFRGGEYCTCHCAVIVLLRPRMLDSYESNVNTPWDHECYTVRTRNLPGIYSKPVNTGH